MGSLAFKGGGLQMHPYSQHVEEMWAEFAWLYTKPCRPELVATAYLEAVKVSLCSAT